MLERNQYRSQTRAPNTGCHGHPRRLLYRRQSRSAVNRAPGPVGPLFSLHLSSPHTLSSQPLSSLRALVRVAAGLPGGFSRARIGPFGLRGDARGRCRSRRERIAKPATPRPVLRPLGIAQGQRCRTRRHLPGLPRTEHPPQPAGGPRRRMLGAVGSTRRRSARRRTGCVAAAPSAAYEAQDSSGSSTARNASHGRLTACRSRLMRYPDRADDRRASLFFRRGALCMLACVVLGILCA